MAHGNIDCQANKMWWNVCSKKNEFFLLLRQRLIATMNVTNWKISHFVCVGCNLSLGKFIQRWFARIQFDLTLFLNAIGLNDSISFHLFEGFMQFNVTFKATDQFYAGRKITSKAICLFDYERWVFSWFSVDYHR